MLTPGPPLGRRFVEYYNHLAGAHNRFDEAADMFRCFDTDKNGLLDKQEFLTLLHQIFPEHCEELEEMFEEEFAAADTDHSGTISFKEFCAYYDQLVRWRRWRWRGWRRWRAGRWRSGRRRRRRR